MTEDLQNIETTWTNYGEIAGDESVWKSCVAQCVSEHMEGLRYTAEQKAFVLNTVSMVYYMWDI